MFSAAVAALGPNGDASCSDGGGGVCVEVSGVARVAVISKTTLLIFG